MDEELHQLLLDKTEELRAITAAFSTEALVGLCYRKLSDWFVAQSEVSPLASPSRQIYFMLGLMLTTEEPASPRDIEDDDWDQMVELLNWIFVSYARTYWPAKGKLADMDDTWKRVREVSMPVFLEYFNTSILASVEELVSRIKAYLSPFDEALKDLIDVSATEVLYVTEFIHSHLQKSMEDVQEAFRAEYESRSELLKRADDGQWDLEGLRDETRRAGHLDIYADIESKLNALMKIQLSTLESQFGARIAKAYWNLFTSRRGEEADFTYLTERNAAERRPLFEIRDGTAFCPSVNALYIANLVVLEDHIASSDSRDRYFSRRDKVLEDEILAAMQGLFGQAADYFAETYETKDLQHEHDLLVLWSRALFVIESKASPPAEPFRDPERAYVRIERDFKSDTGIQRAYDQAIRVYRALANGDTLHLHDSKREVVASISPQDVDDVFCICATRDNYGPLAVDLSLLLEKQEADPYPWATNILDLKYMLKAWKYFGWGGAEFREFIEDRIRLHGKILTFDELEVAGFYIRHGSLRRLVDADVDRIWLAIDYSDVFDDVYYATIGGPPVNLVQTEPVMENVSERLRELLDSGPQA